MNRDLEKPAVRAMVTILGMHRSGTSCLSGCLEERGLDLGDVSNAAPFNKKGNKENLEFRAINDAVLSLSGGAWDRPPEQLRWDNDLRDRRDAYLAKYKSLDLWGAKDPRTLLTLPFWQEAEIKLLCVGTFRHPAAVASSLEARPRMIPATPSLNLWKHYNLKLLNYARYYHVPLICFDLSAAAYLDSVDKISQSLGLNQHSHKEKSFFEERYRHHLLDDFINDSCDIEYIKIYNELLDHAISERASGL